jgi:exodeoxyribonuclease VII large subunit
MAKAIYGSRIPVMTAIGHELDVTIADLVADVRASVPMDAGQRLATPWVQAEERIATIEHNILSAFKASSHALEQKLQAYGERALACYTNRMSAGRKRIDFYEVSLTRCFKEMLLRVKRIESDFDHNYERFSLRLSENRQTIASLHAQLDKETQRYIVAVSTSLNGTEKQFTHNFTRLSRYVKSLSEDVATLEGTMGKRRNAGIWRLQSISLTAKHYYRLATQSLN